MAQPSNDNARMHAAAAVLLLLVAVFVASPPGTTAIGVNYGTKGDNLLPPAKVAAFLANRTRIDRVKLFDANPDMVRAFAGTGLKLVITAGNGDIPSLATKDGAEAWVAAHVAPFYPATDISLVAVGNEIVDTGDQSLIGNLVPAIRALRSALVAAGFRKIRVSTPHSLGILVFPPGPPSMCRFRPGLDRSVLAPMLQFHRQTHSPFVVNAYPYFGYNGATLDYALARPNPGVLDPGTGVTYTSMFEAQLDSVFSAMKSLGYEDVDIMIGETGWPTKAMDGQIGVSHVEAAEYNRYLIGETSDGSGTPLMPKRTFEAYIFALFNENLKPGPVAERNFGLFQPDLTPMYDIGIMKDGTAAPAPTAAQAGAPPEGAPPSSKAGNGTTKRDSEVAAPPPEVNKPANSSVATAPAPSGEENRQATGPAPSAGGSTDEAKKPGEKEAGDAPAAAASESAEIAAEDGGGGGGESTEKAGDGDGGGASPAPSGASSQAVSLVVVPISSMLMVALSSLALHM